MPEPNRKRRVMSGPPGTRAVLDGRDVLYFGGTSYLGLHSEPLVIAAAEEATRIHGVHTATSPSGYGRSTIQEASESALADLFQTERGFHFASGYFGMAIALKALEGSVDHVLVDDGLHQCGVDALAAQQPPQTHISHYEPQDLRIALHSIPSPMRVLLAVDGVDPGTGDVAPLDHYAEILLERPGSVMLVDDAHGYGVLGDGLGTPYHFGLGEYCNRGSPSEPRDLSILQVGTASKALGAHGGTIAGDEDFIQGLVDACPHHAGASAPTAAACGALTAAIPMVVDPLRRQHVQDRAKQLREGLKDLGQTDLRFCQSGKDHPLVTFSIGDRESMIGLEAALWKRGIALPYVPCYGALAPPGAMRCIVTASHDPEQIDELLRNLRDLL